MTFSSHLLFTLMCTTPETSHYPPQFLPFALSVHVCHHVPPFIPVLTVSLFICLISQVLKGHDDHVITCLQFCGNRIVSGSDDNTLKVWSAVTGKVRVNYLSFSRVCFLDLMMYFTTACLARLYWQTLMGCKHASQSLEFIKLHEFFSHIDWELEETAINIGVCLAPVILTRNMWHIRAYCM